MDTVIVIYADKKNYTIDSEDTWIKAKKAMELLGISRNTLCTYKKKGIIKYKYKKYSLTDILRLAYSGKKKHYVGD